jgi:hypothetical protein
MSCGSSTVDVHLDNASMSPLSEGKRVGRRPLVEYSPKRKATERRILSSRRVRTLVTPMFPWLRQSWMQDHFFCDRNNGYGQRNKDRDFQREVPTHLSQNRSNS